MITPNGKGMFRTFNDGICTIHCTDDDGNAGDVVAKVRFQKRTIGVTRFYEAMTAKVQLDKLIRIPLQPWLTTEYFIVIGAEVYEIKQAQEIMDTMPKASDVSLKLTRQRRVYDASV